MAGPGLLAHVLMVTSKGSVAVMGSGFVTLAATLASMGKIPVAGMVLLPGVERFISEAQAITNTIGNAVGTLVVARGLDAVDRFRMKRVLDGEAVEVERLSGSLESAAHDDSAGELIKQQNAQT